MMLLMQMLRPSKADDVFLREARPEVTHNGFKSGEIAVLTADCRWKWRRQG